MRILGIDFGLKKIGLAIANTKVNTVVPIDFFFHKNSRKDIKFLKKTVEEYEIDKIVIGYPLNMDGTKSEMSELVSNFSKKIIKELKMDVELVDERLTTFEAKEELKKISQDYKKSKKYIDSISAVIILKDYLEEKR